MSYEVVAVKGRTTIFAGGLYMSDGSPVSLGPSDKLRFKVGLTDAATPLLDLLSGTVTLNGSTITITDRGSANAPAQYAGELAEADVLPLAIGIYDAELIVLDYNVSNPNPATKQVEAGVVHVQDGMA